MIGKVVLNAVSPVSATLRVALLLGFLSSLPLAAAVAQGQGTAVRVDAVRSEPMEQTVPVIGRLVARRAGVVAARINGAVERFEVEVGDRLEQGQTIAVLDTETLSARRDLAAGQLTEAKAQVDTRQASLTLARQEDRRIKGLENSAAFSKARAEDAAQQVAIAAAELSEAEANLATYRAELERSEINLKNATVVAPYAGVVVERLTETGAYLQTGEPVVRLVADEALEIEADVPFQRLSGLPTGSLVEIALDDGTRHFASVRAVVPQENPLTRTRVVRFVPDFGETSKPLAAAQSVTVQVPIAAARDALTVHKDAVIQGPNGAIVYVAENGAVRLQPVRLGEAIGSRLEVMNGLSEGEQVVVRGNERLRPGDKIQVEKAATGTETGAETGRDG